MAAWRWKYIRYSPIYLYLPTAQIKCVLHKIELKKKKKKNIQIETVKEYSSVRRFILNPFYI